MVRIRLRRVGTKGKALYKVIVADQRSPQKGKYLEEVGTYDPHTNPASINLNEDNKDVKKTIVALQGIKKMNPKLIIKYWKSSISILHRYKKSWIWEVRGALLGTRSKFWRF